MLSLIQSLAKIGKKPPIRIPSELPLSSHSLRETLLIWNGHQYDLLIAAPREFIESLKSLRVHKDSTGVVTRLLSLEEIYQAYLGRDEAEQVKHCLASYETHHHLRYAMLVGDCDKFPVRYAKGDRYPSGPDDPTHNTGFCPTDLYYADLFEADGSFGDWDRNGNGYFAELQGGSVAGKLNIEDIDLRPDIAVGRIPASTVDEVETYVSKVIRYELGAHGSTWVKDALLIATTNWVADACKTQDYIAEHYLGDFIVHKLYEAGNPCEATEIPNSDTINALLNQGVGLVSYVGHAGPDCLQIPDGLYCIADLARLSNSDRLPVMFAAGCSTSYFATEPPTQPYMDINGTYHVGTEKGEVFPETPPQPACIQIRTNPESLGEHITVKMSAGAIGFVGSQTGAQPYSIDLNKFFFKAIHAEGRTLGEMWNYMLHEYYDAHVPPLNVDPPDWTKVAEFHQPWKFFLFGDPSLRLGGTPPL